MIIYNIQTNGPSSELVIEVIKDGVYIEPNLIAYVLGDLTLDAKIRTVGNKFQSYFVGEKYYMPRLVGTGKIYLKPTIGMYHKFNIKDNESLIVNNKAFAACRETLQLKVQCFPSLAKFLSGSPMVNTEISGTGNLVIQMPGMVSEITLANDKFVAYSSDVAAYSTTIQVTRENASKQGGLAIAHKYVDVYRGTGNIYFTPHPNKDCRSLDKK